MPKYDFKFSPDFADQSAVVTDSSGAEVDGSPATLDGGGNVQLTLVGDDLEVYTAVTSNAGRALGNAHTVGVLNLVDSLAASGGGGGALSLAAEEFYAEMGSARIGTGHMVIDSVSDELNIVAGNVADLPAGYYRISGQVECTRPEEIHALTFEVTSTSTGSVYVPAVSIYPDGSGTIGKNTNFQVHIPVEEGDTLSIAATEGCVDGTPTPDPLELSYAYFGITRIG